VYVYEYRGREPAIGADAFDSLWVLSINPRALWVITANPLGASPLVPPLDVTACVVAGCVVAACDGAVHYCYGTSPL
jgi:hypothetical protein